MTYQGMTTASAMHWLIFRGCGSALLPWPATTYLDLQREAQERADDDDPAEYRYAAETGLGSDGADDVAGHQQFQSQQDGLAETLTKPAVDVGLAMGESNQGNAERDHCSDDDDDDPCAVDGHPDLLDNVVVGHLAPARRLDWSARRAQYALEEMTLARRKPTRSTSHFDGSRHSSRTAVTVSACFREDA